MRDMIEQAAGIFPQTCRGHSTKPIPPTNGGLMSHETSPQEPWEDGEYSN